jgi:hypothetical protein
VIPRSEFKALFGSACACTRLPSLALGAARP